MEGPQGLPQRLTDVLLKQCRFRIAPLVREYLAGNGVLTMDRRVHVKG